MAVSGIGTKDNPYVVDTIEELYEYGVSNVYIKLGRDLDANDYNNGDWDLWGTNLMANIDGNNHVIRNIVVTAKPTNGSSGDAFHVSAGFSMSNVVIRNCKVSGNLFHCVHSGYGMPFTRCNIECECGNIFSYSGSNSRPVITECTISANTSANPFTVNSAGAYYKRCQMKLKVAKGGGNMFPTNGEMAQCRIEMEFLEQDSQFIIRKDTIFNNCVIAVKTVGDYGVSFVEYPLSDPAKITIMDKSLISGNIEGYEESETDYFKLLTTEDMKSASKLNAIGFTVIAV